MKKFAKTFLLLTLIFSFCTKKKSDSQTQTAKQDRTITLNLWEHEKDEDQKALDEVIQYFEKENPSIKIKRSHYKTEDLRSQFQTAAMGGGGADLVIAPNDFGGPFSIMGIIKQVQDFAQLERFESSIVSSITDDQNRAWGLPLSKGNHLMLMVNGNMLPEAPTTFEELIVKAKTLTNSQENRYGLVFNLTEPFWFIPFLNAFGESPITAHQPQLNGDGMKKALRLLSDLKFRHKIVPSDCDYVCAESLFLEQKAAMIINGDWAIEKYASLLKDKLILAPLPLLSETQKPMSPYISGKYLFYNAALKDQKFDASKLFGEYLVSPSTQELFIKKTRRLSSLKNSDSMAALKEDKFLKESQEAMKFGVPMPLVVEMRVVWDALRPQLQKIMSEEKTDLTVATAIMQKDALTKITEMKQ